MEGPRSCRGDARPQQCHPNTDQMRNQQTDGELHNHKYPPRSVCVAVDISQADTPIVTVAFCLTSHIQTFVKRAATNWSLVPCPGPSGPFQRPFSAPREVNQANDPQPPAPLPSEDPGTLSPALFPQSLQHQQPNTERLFAICTARLFTTHGSARPLPSCSPHLSNSHSASHTNSQPRNVSPALSRGQRFGDLTI